MPYSKRVQELIRTLHAQVGSKLRIVKKGVEIVGYLMPREDIDFGNRDAIILKLENGYNIGVSLDDTTEVKLLEGNVSLGTFPSLSKVKQDSTLPSISMISTGGTISSRIDYLSGGVEWHFSPEEILFGVPELLGKVYLRNVETLFKLASEDITPAEWFSLAKTIVKFLAEGDRGVLVLHGTDTMHYTGAALSFMIRDLNAPIIITGAQRSSDRASRDSNLNIMGASIAASRLDAAVVAIAMHGSSSDEFVTLIRGTRARKMHTSRRDAFRTINAPEIGRVWIDGRIEMTSSSFKARSTDRPWDDAVFENKTTILKTFPGADPESLDFLVDRDYRGVIIEGTGLGHVPTSTEDTKKSWVPVVERAVQEDMIVCITSQCINGRTDPFVYKNGRILLNAGAVYLGDMLTEVGYVKLGWLLGHNFDTTSVKAMMTHNFSGELGERETYDLFY
jgi:glutamyl-tRNA(Gln) amidotransferase subunit D